MQFNCALADVAIVPPLFKEPSDPIAALEVAGIAVPDTAVPEDRGAFFEVSVASAVRMKTIMPNAILICKDGDCRRFGCQDDNCRLAIP